MIFNKVNKDVFLKWFLIIWSAFTFLFVAFVIPPRIVGDGYEYIYMSESFVQHNTPNLLQSDFENAQNNLKKQNDITKFPDSYRGYFRSQDGNYYSYHFWLYSLVVSPIKSLIRSFHGNELLAFSITNVLLYIAMLWVIFCFSPQKYRFLLVGLMAFSPLIPSITWTHTEVFCATLVAMASVFWLRKNYKLALLFSSLASCQNPPIIAFTIWVCFAYLYNVYKQYRETKKIDLRDFIITGLCALPAILSPLFYYIKFSTLNLIKHVGASDFNLISFHKFLSYFFDLNQGAILGLGLLFFVFMYYVIKNLIHRNFDNFEFVVFLIFFAGLSLTTPNWSLSSTVCIRYFLWAYPLIAFYTAYNINNEKIKHLLSWILMINMFVLCCIHNWFIGGIGQYHNLIARNILYYAPSLYNPEHQIFYRKTNHVADSLMRQSYPIIYTATDGNVRKVLTDKRGWESIENNEDYIIRDVDFYKSQLSKLTDDKPNYINVHGNKIVKGSAVLEINKTIMFNEIDKRITGLSAKESFGRWSDSETVQFRLKFLSLNRDSKYITLKFKGNPFINNKHKNLKIDVFANNNLLSVWDFGISKPLPETTVTIPTAEILENSNILELRFEINTPESPKQLGLSQDSRKLGFGFISIE